jgi:hypothetical protein
MQNPRIYADFHNADAHGRLRLNCAGTVEDLAQQHVELHEGLQLTLYSDDLDDKGQLDDLVVNGVVAFSAEEQCWVAAIDWAAIRHASEGADDHGDGNGRLVGMPRTDRSQPKEYVGSGGWNRDDGG